MFNSQQDEKNGVEVALTLTTGETVKGKISAGMTGKIADSLNKPEPFIDVTKADGNSVLIAKSVVAQIAKIEIPRTDQLSRNNKPDANPDAFSVLGVGPSASLPDIQSAYHALARKYHPDHFSGRDVPKEILQYASAMFQRITIAYNELKELREKSNAA